MGRETLRRFGLRPVHSNQLGVGPQVGTRKLILMKTKCMSLYEDLVEFYWTDYDAVVAIVDPGCV